MDKKSKITNMEKEKYYFEQFRRIFPLPPGDVVYGDTPDVIINMKNKRKLGIEIVNFYREDGSNSVSEQRQIELRKDVVSSSQKKYLDKKGGKFEISFSFNKTYPIPARRLG